LPPFGTFLQLLVTADLQSHGCASYCNSYRTAYLPLTIDSPSGGPVKSLLDPSFKYVPSVETDIRKTFARIRREARREVTTVASGRDRDRKIALLFSAKKRAS